MSTEVIKQLEGKIYELCAELQQLHKSQPGMPMRNGRAYPSEEAGLGIDWDWEKLTALADSQFSSTQTN